MLCAFPSAPKNADVMPITTANVLHLRGGEAKAKDGRRKRPKEPRSLVTCFNPFELLQTSLRMRKINVLYVSATFFLFFC